MSFKTIQIKKSTSGNPVSLLEGELGYVIDTNKLFIGNTTNTPVECAGSSFAKLDSPNFINSPTAPTQSINTNNSNLSTCAFVYNSQIKNNVLFKNQSDNTLPADIDAVYVYSLDANTSVQPSNTITKNTQIIILNASNFQLRVLNFTLDIYLSPSESCLLIGNASNNSWYPLFYNSMINQNITPNGLGYATNSFYQVTNRINCITLILGSLNTNQEYNIVPSWNYNNNTILSYTGFVVANGSGNHYILPFGSTRVTLGSNGLFLVIDGIFGASINRGFISIQYSGVVS